MIDLLKKGIYTGVGLGLMAKDKVEEIAKQAAAEAKLSEEDGKKFMHSIIKQSEESARGLEDKIKEKVSEVIEKLNIPTGQKISDLEKRIVELESKLSDKQ